MPISDSMWAPHNTDQREAWLRAKRLEPTTGEDSTQSPFYTTDNMPMSVTSRQSQSVSAAPTSGASQSMWAPHNVEKRADQANLGRARAAGGEARLWQSAVGKLNTGAGKGSPSSTPQSSPVQERSSSQARSHIPTLDDADDPDIAAIWAGLLRKITDLDEAFMPVLECKHEIPRGKDARRTVASKLVQNLGARRAKSLLDRASEITRLYVVEGKAFVEGSEDRRWATEFDKAKKDGLGSIESESHHGSAARSGEFSSGRMYNGELIPEGGRRPSSKIKRRSNTESAPTEGRWEHDHHEAHVRTERPTAGSGIGKQPRRYQGDRR